MELTDPGHVVEYEPKFSSWYMIGYNKLWISVFFSYRYLSRELISTSNMFYNIDGNVHHTRPVCRHVDTRITCFKPVIRGFKRIVGYRQQNKIFVPSRGSLYETQKYPCFGGVLS